MRWITLGAMWACLAGCPPKSTSPNNAGTRALEASSPSQSEDPLAGAAQDVCGYRALFFAAEDYRDPEIGDLDTPVQDVTKLAFVLRNQYQFETEVVENPTRNTMLAALEDLAASVRPCEGVVLYYAGHGVTEVDGNYWLPVDARASERSSYLDTARVTEAIEALSAKHVLLIADSCYSGNLADEPEPVTADEAADRSRWVITSGGNEPVIDSFVSTNMSVFAYYLHAELSDAIDQYLVPVRQFNPIRKLVVAATRGGQEPQIGVLPGDSGGHLVLRNRRPRTKEILPVASTLLSSQPFEPPPIWERRAPFPLLVSAGIGMSGYTDPGEEGEPVGRRRTDSYLDISARFATGSMPGLHLELALGVGLQSGVAPNVGEGLQIISPSSTFVRVPLRVTFPIRFQQGVEGIIGPFVAEAYAGGGEALLGGGIGFNPFGFGFRARKAGWFRVIPSTLMLRVGPESSLTAGQPVVVAWHAALMWSPSARGAP
ncbi:MAG: caspase family protein [Myxococcales bacterium]|nr:caspase family protein [Myxococcales bacterium]